MCSTAKQQLGCNIAGSYNAPGRQGGPCLQERFGAAIGVILRRSPWLVSVDAANNGMTHDAFVYFADALGHLQDLCFLNLSDNPLGPAATSTLATAICQPLPTGRYHTVHASERVESCRQSRGSSSGAPDTNGRSDNEIASMSSSIRGSEAAGANDSGVGRRFSAYDHEAESSWHPHSAAFAPPELQHLRLGWCRFGEGVTCLATVVATRHLRSLDISGSPCPQVAVAALAKALTVATALQRLNLGSMALGGFGARVLAPCIQNLVALQTLALDDNLLEDYDAIHLARAAAILPHLLNLSLEDNLISKACMLELRSMEFAGHVRVTFFCDVGGDTGSDADAVDDFADQDNGAGGVADDENGFVAIDHAV
jgi:hypothetical protein